MEGIIEEPTVCPDPGCGAKHLMKLLHNRSEFSNKQLIKMQVCCHGLLASFHAVLSRRCPPLAEVTHLLEAALGHAG